METDGKFYLGRVFDPAVGKSTQQSLLYDPDDLTTHAVVVGMTGSGKTGLCIGLMEEAALNNVPALLIDPKGDITNLLLHFPDLLPQDFRPWMNPDEARRAGQTLDQAAEAAANLWRKSLGDWGIEPARIEALKKAADFAIYTPGSDSGIPVSILASFKAPSIPWEENKEMLREKISGTVIAILSLVGMSDIDPVRSREHILISNIFESAWSQGKDLDLGELILQVQEPPFSKLGVFDVNRFFPEKDRFELAMLLNNILASPSFQAWLEGQPLDIPSLLYTPDGRSRHCVFYIAHLTDQERMFFVTLLYSAVESWMRSQTGTSTLRALVYFDEIFGYLPPVKNPPSKMLLLRLLKQARAFGVGQVLVTQNPVDLDYKALSNAGSWFIGKLQTDQDKQRLLDGLQGAMAGAMDRAQYDKLLSSLGKRVFLLHNVHSSGPQTFQTRWAMNYLAGPLTRTQLPGLNRLVGAKATPEAPAPVIAKPPAQSTSVKHQSQSAPAVVASAAPAAVKASTATPGATTAARPPLASGIDEYFLPNNLTLDEALKLAGRSYPQLAFTQALIYRPLLLAQASARFLDRKYNLDVDLKRTALVAAPDRRGTVRWDAYPYPPVEERSLDRQAAPQARFAALESPLDDPKTMGAMQKDFLDWAYRTSEVNVWANEALKLFAGPEVSQADFAKQCASAARKALDLDVRKVEDAYEKKEATIKDKMEREQREMDQDEADYNQRKMEEVGAGFDTLMGMLGGRKRSISKNLSKRRMTSTAKADIDESKKAIKAMQAQIDAMEKDKAQEIAELTQHWNEVADHVTKISVTPLKKDVLVELFGLAWMPYYVLTVDGENIELAGFSAG